MLDVSINRGADGSLTFDVYRKPTHTNQYIQFHSHAPLSHKLATIRSLTRRSALIPSTEENKRRETKRVEEALAMNGYPRWAYDLARYRQTPSGSGEEPIQSTTAPSTSSQKSKGFVTLPYFSGSTEPLTRILRRAGISAHVRARGTLKEKLVRSKDKIPTDEETGVVYFSPCAGSNGQKCESNAAYIGETSRKGCQRFREHMSTAKLYNGDYKSAIMQHAADSGHTFRDTDLTILDRDPNWRSRGIRESIFIRALSPSLNRRSDRNDRYTLPPTYDSILKGHIQRPPSPTPHQQGEPRTFNGDRRPGRPRLTQATEEETAAKSIAHQQEETVAKSIAQQQQPLPIHTMTTRSRARASGGPPDTT